MTIDSAFREALNNRVEDVNIYYDFMDNRFTHCNIKEVIHRCIVYQYLPIGYCPNSRYKPRNGIVFVVMNNENKKRWAFIPIQMFRDWLTQCDIDWVEHLTGREYFKKYKKVVLNAAHSLGISENKFDLIEDDFLKECLRNTLVPKDVVTAVFPEYINPV